MSKRIVCKTEKAKRLVRRLNFYYKHQVALAVMVVAATLVVFGSLATWLLATFTDVHHLPIPPVVIGGGVFGASCSIGAFILLTAGSRLHARFTRLSDRGEITFEETETSAQPPS